MATSLKDLFHLICLFILVNIAICDHNSDQLPVQKPENSIGYYTSSQIHDILVDNEVIGDVLDDFTPSISLSVNYPSSHESVNLGNDIPVKSVQSRPVLEFHPFTTAHHPSSSFANDTVYTLALTDPDATSRSNPKWGEVCHWIVTNFTLTPDPSFPSFSLSTLSELGELVPYLPPSPPPSTGSHRYIFVLLASPTGDHDSASETSTFSSSSSGLKAPKDRKHWGFKRTRDGKKVGERKGRKGQGKTPRTVGVAKWAEKMGLQVVGVNFFFAQNEEQ